MNLSTQLEHATLNSPLAQARTFLFVPGDRPERFAKALSSGTDALVIDLEDAVSPAGKAAARDALRKGFDGIPGVERSRVLVRLNGESSPWFSEDVQLARVLSGLGLGGLVVSKAESAQVLQQLADVAPQSSLFPLIESAAGLDALDQIARCGSVLRLCLGHLDLQNDLGITCGREEEEIAPARWAIVRASRRANLLPPIDGVTTDARNAEIVARDAARSVRLGFGGKLCIHPAQVSPIHQAFSPTDAEVVFARKVLDAAARAAGGVCIVDGRMVDMPVIARANRTVAARTATRKATH